MEWLTALTESLLLLAAALEAGSKIAQLATVLLSSAWSLIDTGLVPIGASAEQERAFMEATVKATRAMAKAQRAAAPE